MRRVCVNNKLVPSPTFGLFCEIIREVHRPGATPVHCVETISESHAKYLPRRTRADDTSHPSALHGESDAVVVASSSGFASRAFSFQ